MLYSRSWQYAVRILLHLAQLEPGERQSARTIAGDIGIPAPYASKILSTLANARLVRSQRGPRGGVMIARPAREILLQDVVAAVGEESAMSECVLGFSACSDVTPCPVHVVWAQMRQDLRSRLLSRTLEDFRESTASTPAVKPPGRPRRR